MNKTAPNSSESPMPTSIICRARIVLNDSLCREHFRLTFVVQDFPPAAPGQFIQIHPVIRDEQYIVHDWAQKNEQAVPNPPPAPQLPMLPRAFSIAGLRRKGRQVEIDLIYRVVGVATTWMASLTSGDQVEILGPLGGSFPILPERRNVWLVAGGVGLPPLLWLAERLRDSNHSVIAFAGCASRELIPLSLTGDADSAAKQARRVASEFAEINVPIVISTDDGSFGFDGNIVQAVQTYHAANSVANGEFVVYTCGPERMMRGVADFCRAHGVQGYVCMERPMACGTGTCQSCIVTVRTDGLHNHRYALCCTEGPVFAADAIIWDEELPSDNLNY